MVNSPNKNLVTLKLLVLFITVAFLLGAVQAIALIDSGSGSTSESYAGKYLHVVMNTSTSPPQLHSFYISNQTGYSGGMTGLNVNFESALIITEPDTQTLGGENEKGAYNITTGEVLKAGSGSLQDQLKPLTGKSNSWLNDGDSSTDIADVEVDGTHESHKGDKCDDNVCSVVKVPFSSDSGDIQDMTGVNVLGIDKQDVLLEEGSGQKLYQPREEVIKGYEPATADTSDKWDGQGPFFFRCAYTPKIVVDGNNPNAGQEPNHYMCPASGNSKGWDPEDWRQVSVCSDDLDNDGDGVIDHDGGQGKSSDDGCSGSSDNSELVQWSDAKRVEPTLAKGDEVNRSGTGADAKYYYVGDKLNPDNLDSDKIVALWNGTEQNGEKYYANINISFTIQNKEPIVFGCDKNGDISNYTSLGSGTEWRDRKFDANATCTSFANSHSGDKFYHYDMDYDGVKEVSMVEYYIPPKAAYSSDAYGSNIIDGVCDKGCLERDSNIRLELPYHDVKGVENWKYQTLHKWERGIMNSSEVSDSNTPNLKVRQGLWISTTHNDESYDHLNLKYEVHEVYAEPVEDQNPSEYIKPWNVSNATGPQDVTNTVGTNFPGGFHGECPGDLRWRKNNGEWKCQLGQIELAINFYNRRLPANDNSLEGNYVGFQLNDSEKDEWESAYPTEFDGDSNTEPVRVRAQCWVGGPSTRPAEPDDTSQHSDIEMRVPVAGPYHGNSDEKTVVSFITPNRNGDVPFNELKYSCIYGFSQNITSATRRIASLELYNSTGGRVGVTTKGALQNHLDSGKQAYIVVGTQEFSNVIIERVPNIFPGGSDLNGTEQEDWLDSNTDLGDGGDASVEVDGLWSMFPKNPFSDKPSKHPGYYFDSRKYPCSPHGKENSLVTCEN